MLLKKGTSNTQIILVHPAGGDILSYYDLAEQFEDTFTVYGLQNPHFDVNDATINAMASRYLELVRREIPNGNYIFGGWSMGALVGFEMAKQLEESTTQKVPVILLDQKAPSSNLASNKVIEKIDRLSVFAEKIEHLVGQKTSITKDSLTGLTEKEQSALFLKEFKKNNLVPEEVDLAQFHGFLDKTILHNEITMDYQTTVYDGPVMLIRAEDSTFVTDEFENAVCYGWSNYTEANNFQIIPTKGNHITLIRPPFVIEMAKHLNKLLSTIYQPRY